MSHITTIVITDAELLAKLAEAEGQIIFRNSSGDTVKTVEVVANCAPPPGVVSPFADEEVEEMKAAGQRHLPAADLAGILKAKGLSWFCGFNSPPWDPPDVDWTFWREDAMARPLADGTLSPGWFKQEANVSFPSATGFWSPKESAK